MEIVGEKISREEYLSQPIEFKDIEDFKKHYESLKYQCFLD